jgi:hypothetical protein
MLQVVVGISLLSLFVCLSIVVRLAVRMARARKNQRRFSASWGWLPYLRLWIHWLLLPCCVRCACAGSLGRPPGGHEVQAHQPKRKGTVCRAIGIVGASLKRRRSGGGIRPSNLKYFPIAA